MPGLTKSVVLNVECVSTLNLGLPIKYEAGYFSMSSHFNLSRSENL